MRLSLKKCEDVAFESYSVLMYFFFGGVRAVGGGYENQPKLLEKKWKISICISICYSCSMETESMFFFFFSHWLINSFKDINLLRLCWCWVGDGAPPLRWKQLINFPDTHSSHLSCHVGSWFNFSNKWNETPETVLTAIPPVQLTLTGSHHYRPIMSWQNYQATTVL